MDDSGQSENPKKPKLPSNFRYVHDPFTKKIICRVDKIQPKSPKYIEIANTVEFKKNANKVEKTGLKVHEVFIVTYSDVSKPYTKFRDSVKEDKVKNRILGFHVTDTTNTQPLLIQGFDQRLARFRNRFGRGLYFTDDPLKANLYWRVHNKRNLRMMLGVVLNLGKMKIYPPNVIDPKLLREPEGYDSVKGQLLGKTEYVIYDGSRANIRYIITYRDENTKKSLEKNLNIT